MPPDTTPSTETQPAPVDLDDLDAARALAAEIRSERDAQQALFAAGIIDLETGVALVKHRAAASPDKPDIAAIVKDLRAAKPALFRAPAPTSPTRSPSTTLAPAITPDPRTDLARAADTARESGDGRSLMTYLRLRRAAAD